MSFLKRLSRSLSGLTGGAAGEWERIWKAREAALVRVLGPVEDTVLHSPMPLDRGGDADVLVFRHYVPGVTYVTADLTGSGVEQVPGPAGNYELMICTHNEVEWAPYIVSRLARYTLEAQLAPGDTMDVGPIAGSEMTTLLFTTPDLPAQEFAFLGQRYALLLCIGIHGDELEAARSRGPVPLLSRLRAQNVFPYTEPNRLSVEG